MTRVALVARCWWLVGEHLLELEDSPRMWLAGEHLLELPHAPRAVPGEVIVEVAVNIDSGVEEATHAAGPRRQIPRPIDLQPVEPLDIGPSTKPANDSEGRRQPVHAGHVKEVLQHQGHAAGAEHLAE